MKTRQSLFLALMVLGLLLVGLARAPLASRAEEMAKLYLPLLTAPIPPPPPGATIRVSVASDGAEADGNSDWPAISGDGRIVAFASGAGNLVAGDTSGLLWWDIFVYEVDSGETTRVSVASDGSAANGHSVYPSLSAGGRWVAFVSAAANLVPGDSNDAHDVFVHDRLTGATTRVSVASDGEEGHDNVDARWGAPPISAGGRFVAFGSRASNPVPGDTNMMADIFVHDRLTGETSRVSVASDGSQANGWSEDPALSADGRFVAFHSEASNLVAGDTNGMYDVFVHDRATGATTLVSLASDGTQGESGSYWPSLSPDGRFVSFISVAANLVQGDTNGYYDVFVHDRETGQTSRVSIASDGSQGNQASVRAAISDGGRFVVFGSIASNLVPGDTNDAGDIFVHDRANGTTTRLSVATNGTQGNSHSYGSAISTDAGVVAFVSAASNLVLGDMNGAADIFVHYRAVE
jgi:Tol biopolymer transport system component